MHTPLFWKDKTKLSTALLPAAAIYGFFAGSRNKHAQGVKLSVPVVCIGNAVAGGSGKTPVSLALGQLLKARNIHAHYLTRGYKGEMHGPVSVDTFQHTAIDVGDEPMLLAQMLPTWVARDRVAGGRAAIHGGAALIIMDDGFQNPSLHKDVSFLVIDGAYGFGNGRMIPAGPLREPVAAAMKRATAVILIGDDRYRVLRDVPLGMPVFRATIEPMREARLLKGLSVVAFAGIARPRKFYRTLQQIGCQVVHMVSYPDHYLFKEKDLHALRVKAKQAGARLVTTTKDYVRLPADMRAEVMTVPIEAVFEDSEGLLKLITGLTR